MLWWRWRVSRQKRQHVSESSSEDSVWGSASHSFLDLFSLQGDESTKVPESLPGEMFPIQAFPILRLSSGSCYSSVYCLSLRVFRRWTLTSLLASCRLRFDQHAIHFLIQTVTEIADQDGTDIGTMQPPWPLLPGDFLKLSTGLCEGLCWVSSWHQMCWLVTEESCWLCDRVFSAFALFLAS